MKVFIATLVWHYEGADVLGVFDSEEKARCIGEERRSKEGYLRGDELEVTEWEVE